MPVDIAATTIALKVSSPVPPSLPPPPIPIAVSTVPTTSTVLSPMQQQQHAVESQASGSGRGDDDIYEFREPEPFEFEVRTRRESPFSEDRVHHRFTQRKTTKEEEEDPSPKKTNAMPVVNALLILSINFINCINFQRNDVKFFFCYLALRFK